MHKKDRGLIFPNTDQAKLTNRLLQDYVLNFCWILGFSPSSFPVDFGAELFKCRKVEA